MATVVAVVRGMVAAAISAWGSSEAKPGKDLLTASVWGTEERPRRINSWQVEEPLSPMTPSALVPPALQELLVLRGMLLSQSLLLVSLRLPLLPLLLQLLAALKLKWQ
mmetsp:Transcript_33765/g.66434  ORF Transcript_33765/g.66434 Transcript_33765/m.66434 type:complete len:108 (+) Transcript_33765:572-895(+)